MEDLGRRRERAYVPTTTILSRGMRYPESPPQVLSTMPCRRPNFGGIAISFVTSLQRCSMKRKLGSIVIASVALPRHCLPQRILPGVLPLILSLCLNLAAQ